MHTAEAAAAPAAAPAAPAWISMPDQANSCLIAQILMLDQAWQATVWYGAVRSGRDNSMTALFTEVAMAAGRPIRMGRF